MAIDVAGWACGRGACTIIFRRAPAPKQASLTSFFARKPCAKRDTGGGSGGGDGGGDGGG